MSSDGSKLNASLRVAGELRDAALALGFAGCGIVPVERMHAFGRLMDERIERCPNAAGILKPLRKYAAPEEAYPWARAVVVTVTDYSGFRIPEPLRGRIGAYYLFDHKLQPSTPGSRRIAGLEAAMDGMGMRWAKELHGVTSMRMAAEEAGLGIVRRNNFFCHPTAGSRVILDTWLIDKPLEWSESATVPPCPPECRRCIDACPSGALSGPHFMDPSLCVTLQTWGARALPAPEAAKAAGSWLYGCDLCQDACPLNPSPEGADYPGLEELAARLTLPGIVAMDAEEMKRLLMPKFYFIPEDRLWLWKVNALRAMDNAWRAEYARSVHQAATDGHEMVRAMASRISSQRGVS